MDVFFDFLLCIMLGCVIVLVIVATVKLITDNYFYEEIKKLRAKNERLEEEKMRRELYSTNFELLNLRLENGRLKKELYFAEQALKSLGEKND